MSWSIMLTSIPHDEFVEALASKAEEYIAATDLSEEAVSQITAARNIAGNIVTAGVVGGEARTFSVYLDGHANPDHEPAEGYANDAISIRISQV